MNSEQFYEIVKHMRQAQKEYYNCNPLLREEKQQLLKIAKSFEHRVDAIIAATESEKNNQTLFTQV
jgi:hypothetical protein